MTRAKASSRVVFLVPRRRDGGHRDVLWAWCRARWERLMPDVAIYEGHHDDGPFNRSAAINLAARLADEDGRWDVGVVIDADVFLPIPNVRAAIAAAAAGQVTWAHRRWRGLSEGDTERLIKDPDTFGEVPAETRDMDLIVEKTTVISWSCCVAIPRSTFDDMHGYDERFQGWGFEDGAWAALVRGKYPWGRIEGDMYHWWHSRSNERIVQGMPGSTATPEYIRNALLGRRYMIAAIRDHAAGDQPGEEHLGSELVRIHVDNLTRDDARFLKMAEARRMPEAAWANWWPTLEELQAGARAHVAGPEPTVWLIVRTGGEDETWADRSAYLRRSLESLVERVHGPISQRVVYSDWAPERTGELRAIVEPFGFYVAGQGHLGYARSVARLFAYIDSKRHGEYVFLAEDDFVYDRDVELEPMIETLQRNPHLRQVALLRGAFYPRERGDGILGWDGESFEARDIGNGHGRLEHRNFWTMNPSLFHCSLAAQPWPQVESSERVFGDLLLRDPKARFALWGDGQPWISHIGETRAASAY